MNDVPNHADHHVWIEANKVELTDMLTVRKARREQFSRMGWAVRENRCIDAITAAVQAAGDRYWARFDAVQAATTNAAVEGVVW